MLQAYNDWHILEWCGAYPERFIPQAVAPGWDPQAMADETRRVAAMGCHSITFSENPAKLGLPSLHSDAWDPFWTACSEEGTVVNLHIGSSSSLIMTAADAPIDVTIALTPLNSALALGDLNFSRVIREFPDLRIALNEGGFGWMPWCLERCDYTYKTPHAWTGSDFGGKLPSEVFRERFLVCFVDDPIGMRLRDKVNFDNVMWECDYPHSDSTWPQSPERLVTSLGDLSAEEIDKVTHLNVMRHYQFDPFSIRAREQCTVGALRAEAADVDTSYRSVGKKAASQGIADLAAIVGRQQATA
jgi:predicted TIM-barrel fold metal-dependent hydrolase